MLTKILKTAQTHNFQIIIKGNLPSPHFNPPLASGERDRFCAAAECTMKIKRLLPWLPAGITRGQKRSYVGVGMPV